MWLSVYLAGKESVTQHRSRLREDKDDTLLFEEMQEHVLRNYPNPLRIGCLDEATLEQWVLAPEELDLSDVKYLHVLKCAECTRTLRDLREARKVRMPAAASVDRAERSYLPAKPWEWAALAVTLSILGALFLGGLGWRYHRHSSADGGNLAVAVTIDLSQTLSPRDAAPPVRSAHLLPQRLVNLHLILPYFSPLGSYRVAITKDRLAESVEVEDHALADGAGYYTELSVRLDLRNLKPGSYFLATLREGDSAPHIYPLTVK